MSENTLAARIAQASKIVGGKLSADKTNQEQRYDYISADKILSVAGQALADAGISIIPSITGHTVAQVERAGKSPRNDATVYLTFQITDNSTDGIVVNWIGLGSDYSVPDKAVYKAITSGHKYFLMKLLNIGAGNEDGEREDEKPEPKKSASPEPLPQPSSVMTLEMAQEVKNSKGELYNSLPSDTLAHMVTSMSKAIKADKYQGDELTEVQYKMDAALTILQSRTAQP